MPPGPVTEFDDGTLAPDQRAGALGQACVQGRSKTQCERCRARRAGQWRDETVAQAAHGLDAAWRLDVVTQRASQLDDEAIERCLGDIGVAPDCIEQVVAAEHLIRMGQKFEQHRERLGLETDFRPGAGQPMRTDIHLHVGEGDHA